MMLSKKLRVVNPEEAVMSIQSGDRVVIPLGCGEPHVILEAMVQQSDRLKGVEIVSGLLKNYIFLEQGLEDSFRFRTWHCSSSIAHLIGKTVHYMPIRQGDVSRLFGPDGVYPVDVAVVHVSPPDHHGFCSLGVSIGHALPAALGAKTVIALVNEQMPRVLGKSFMHVSQIDYIVNCSRSLVEFPTGTEKTGDAEIAIANYVADLIPDGAILQLGLGSIPTLITQRLAGKREIKIFGMGIDNIVDLVENGVIQPNKTTSEMSPVVACEFLGTQKLFNFIDNNPLIEGRALPDTINALITANLSKFISVQSAIEVDIYGQINVESIDKRIISGLGGSHDFLQGAYHAPEGKSIIAMTSTTAKGKKSRIVAEFSAGTAVAHPRHSVDYIVTEYGVARLRGKTLEERAEALINITHPDFREDLKLHIKNK